MVVSLQSHLFILNNIIYYDIIQQGFEMFYKSLRKLPNKINKRIVNSRAPRVIPTRNHTRRKVMLASIFLLTIFVFCAFTAIIGSNNNFAHASSVNGIGVGIYWDQACTNRSLSLNWGQVEAGSSIPGVDFWWFGAVS